MQSTQLSDIWTFYVKSGGKCLKRINLEVALEQESICEVPYHATSTMYVKGQEKRLSYMSIKLKKTVRHRNSKSSRRKLIINWCIEWESSRHKSRNLWIDEEELKWQYKVRYLETMFDKTLTHWFMIQTSSWYKKGSKNRKDTQKPLPILKITGCFIPSRDEVSQTFTKKVIMNKTYINKMAMMMTNNKNLQLSILPNCFNSKWRPNVLEN